MSKTKSIIVYAVASLLGFSCTKTFAQTATSFDLSSTQQSVTLSSEHFDGSESAIVNVGGTKTMFKPGDAVTPAVFAALRQVVLSNGHQPLKIDDVGRAVGGKVALNQVLQGPVSNLIIPDNVTALHDSSSALSITGNLITQGSLVSSTKQALQTFSINTGFLQVDPTGRISTRGSEAALNLSLFSATDIVNHGIIESSGSASLTAVGSIINQAAAGSSVVPTISAVSGVNLQALSGSIANSGIISSLGSNVAFNTASGRDLIINNAGGQILASAGNVLLRSPEFNEKRKTELLGGLVEAQSLTVYGGDGVTKILSDEIQAPINIFAGEAHVRVSRGDLILQTMSLTGDPTIVNTGGDITLAGNADGGQTLRFSGEDLAIIASGSINLSGGLNLIDLSSTTSDGGTLTIAAGFLADPVTSGQVTAGSETTYQITGPSDTGGNVNLSGVFLNTSTTDADSDGGNVTVVAHDALDNAGNFGRVAFGGIDTSSPERTSGYVSVIAQSGPIIITDPITTAGFNGGAIYITAGEPYADGTVQFNNGTMSGGGFFNVLGQDSATHPLVDLYVLADLNSTSTSSNANEDYVYLFSSGHTGINVGVDINSGQYLNVIAKEGSLWIAGSNQLNAVGSVHLSAKGNTTLDVGVNINSGDYVDVLSSDGWVWFVGSNQVNAATNIYIANIVQNADGEFVANQAVQPIAIYSNSRFEAQNINFFSQGTFFDQGDNVYHADQDMFVVALANLSIGDGSELSTDRRMFLLNGFNTFADGSSMTIGSNVTLSSLDALGMVSLGTAGAGVVTGPNGISIGTGNSISSGKLSVDAPASGLLSPQDVAFDGFTLIYAGEGDININSNIESIGGDLLVLAREGDLNLGSGTEFTGVGGHIAMFASDQITGDSNTFRTRAAGYSSNFKGGLIQLSSGFSFNPEILTLDPIHAGSEVRQLSREIKKEAQHIKVLINTSGFTAPERDINGVITDTSIMGSNVQITDNGLSPGLVNTSKIGGGTLDLTGSSIDMSKGALFFDSVGSQANITLTNSEFQIASYGVAPPKFFQRLSQQVESALGLRQTIGLRFDSSIILSTDQQSQQNFNQYILDRKKASELLDLPDRKDLPLIRGAHFLAPSPSPRSNNGRPDIRGSRTLVVSTDMGRSSNSTRLGVVVPLGMASVSPLFSQARHDSPTISVAEGRQDLMFFTTTNQVLRGDMAGSPSATVVGQRGSAVSVSPGSLALHNGKVLTTTNKSPLSVQTGVADIQVEPDSSASVSVVPGTGVEVTSLGGKKENVLVSIRGATNQIQLAPGETLVVPENQEDSGQNAGQTRSVQTASKGRFSIRDTINNDNDFFHTAIRLSGSRSSSRLYGHLQEAATSQNVALDLRTLKKVSGDSKNSIPLQLLGTPGTLVKHEEERIRLIEGSIFVYSDKDQLVTSEVGNVVVKAGAIAAIDCNNGKLRVRSCSGPGHVLVDAQNHKFPLSPGQEVLVCTFRPTKSEALGDDQIARRRLEVHPLTGGNFAVTGDFSIVSMLRNSKHLDALRKSTHAVNQRTLASAVRTAASVELATASHGRYYVKPHETAHIPDWVFLNPDRASKLLISSASRF